MAQQFDCSLSLHPGFVAAPPLERNLLSASDWKVLRFGENNADKWPESCRHQRLRAGDESPQACATACLSQSLCGAATFYRGLQHTLQVSPTRRGSCIARTYGAPQYFARLAAPNATTAPVSYVKHCAAPGCDLQRRLDTFCQTAETLEVRCGAGAVARNMRAAAPGKRDSSFLNDDFEWVCVPAQPSNASIFLACVDDRGIAKACPTLPLFGRGSQSPCSSGKAKAALHDIHRSGCGPAHCLSVPGGGEPFVDDFQASAGSTATQGHGQRQNNAPPPSPRPPSLEWRAQRNDGAVAVLDALGYLNCSRQFDEVKVVASCEPNEFRSEYRRWIHYAWQRGGGRRDGKEAGSRGGDQSKFFREEGAGDEALSRAAQMVSWWLPSASEKNGAAPVDVFDADAFVSAVLSLKRAQSRTRSEQAGGAPLSAQEREGKAARRQQRSRVTDEDSTAQVSFVGDSTSRQQAVSLCCLLRASATARHGLKTAAQNYRPRSTGSSTAVPRAAVTKVLITRAVPFLDFRCVAFGGSSADPVPLLRVSFTRFSRVSSVPIWRPPAATPTLPLELSRALRPASYVPTVLQLSLGPWAYEDGCDDMHSLHDSICNGTRPWILEEYAAAWRLMLASLDTAHDGFGAISRVRKGGEKNRRARRGGGIPLVVLRTTPPRDFEGNTAKRGGVCKRSEPLPPRSLLTEAVPVDSMRFAVMSQNAIALGLALSRERPWLRVLDAYGIAYQRADAHPSSAPYAVRKGRGHHQDCLHYCLPGVPDVWNGRFANLVQAFARDAALADRDSRSAHPATAAVDEGLADGVPRSATSSTGAAALDAQKEMEGDPEAVLRRWNFHTAGGMIVEGQASQMSLRLHPESGQTTRVTCPAGRGDVLGFCSDLDVFDD